MTAASCIGEPVSWPRLERFAAGSLDGSLRASVEAHVASCAACRACLDEIRADVVALPALPAAPVRAPSRWARWLFIGGGLAAAATLILLVLATEGPPRPSQDAPGARVAVKGAGTVVLSIVRDRAGMIAYDPSSFRAGDRFKVRVTCDPGASIWADVVVYELTPAGALVSPAFPLAPAQIPCGNDATVPGAFHVTGRDRALVCVSLATGAAPDRAAARHGPTSGQIACAVLAPD